MMNPNHAFDNSNAYANVVGLFSSSNTSINSTFTRPWILDSGITNHIISNPTLLAQAKPSPISIVNLPTGSSAQSL